MQFKKEPMVNWYDVGQLASTGLKTVISSLFGNFADKREIQAAIAPDACFHDFSKTNDTLWLDYVADLGDGFDATYSIAHTLAQASLEVSGHQLNRGDILVMGGDEVYPTPEIKEYHNRLQGPYNAAWPWEDSLTKRPALFAIPGNHDWYDGLTNFIRLFCQKRSLGNWLTEQKRSYFALKLPHNVWLLGIDIQLHADIDAPQMEYFANIAKQHMQPKDKFLLCTAEPSWVFKSWSGDGASTDRINYFINKVIFGEDRDYHERNKSMELVAILTGDLHHYARYEEEFKTDVPKRHLITAGGGGAFAHPTHTLEETIAPNEDSKAKLKAVFPSKSQSKKLAFKNLLFPFYSLSMLLFLGGFHLLSTWILQSSHETLWNNQNNEIQRHSFMESASQIPFLSWSDGAYPKLIWESISHSPTILILNIVLVIGLFLFADTSSRKKRMAQIAGALHGILQVLNFYLLIWLFSALNLSWIGWPVDNILQIVVFTVEMVAIGGLTSTILFGCYLLISTLLIENHPTEAFSSFRWDGYKNFLKIRINKESISIYPVGIKSVVKDWKNVGTEQKPKFEGSELNCQLIEEPINIPL